MKFLVPIYALNSVKITNYFNYERRFNGVLSSNNLPRIKDGANVINLVLVFIIYQQKYSCIL